MELWGVYGHIEFDERIFIYLFFLIKTKYGSYVSNRYQSQLQKPRYKEQLTAQTKNKVLQKQQAQGTKPEN